MATVSAGESASYTVTVTPLIANVGDVSVSCAGLPSSATCTPLDFTLSNGNPRLGTVTVTTTARSFVAPPPSGPGFRPRLEFRVGWLLALLILAAAALANTASRRGNQRLAQMGIAFVLLFALVSTPSRAGSSGGGGVGTPAGNYTVTITGKSASGLNSTTVALTVN